jgi:hypothetical protein
MNKYQRIGIRIAVSTNVGLLVTAVAIVVAWRDIGNMDQIRSEQRTTRQGIRDIERSVQRYRETKATLPESLEEVRGSGGEYSVRFQQDRNGNPLDGWGRPLLYSVTGGEYVITSLGRDGRPGGIGLDCDLSNLKEWPEEAAPSLGQVLAHPSMRGIVRVCLACGVLAFLLSLAIVDPSTIRTQGILPLAITIGLTILGALFIAYFLSLIQIANYH